MNILIQTIANVSHFLKQKVLFLSICVFFIISLTGCRTEQIQFSVRDSLVLESTLSEEPQLEIPLETDSSTQESKHDTIEPTIAMIMVNGTLYYDTGKESSITARCGVMDGQIISTVSEDETPTQDGQSNFGYVGCNYQYGLSGTIEVYMDDTWRVFEQKTDNTTSTKQVEMQVITYTDGIVTLFIENHSEQEYIYGENFSLEKENHVGEWETVLWPDGYAWHDIAYVLPAFDSCEIEHNLSIFGTLPSGNYRIVKDELSAEFIISD